MNDGRVWRSGPCFDHTDGHATQEEAERHFWEYEMALPRRVCLNPEEQRKCEICGAWTQDRVRREGDYRSDVLCGDHQDQASYEALHPFVPGRQVIES